MANLKPRKRGRGAVSSVPDSVEEYAVPHASPVAFEDLSLEALRRYRLRYSLPIAAPTTFEGFLLGGPVGRLSSAHNKYRRSSRRAAQRAVVEHLSEGTVKEGEAIAEFLYTVQHKDQEFKLRFGYDERALAQRAAGAPSGAPSGASVPAHASIPGPAPAGAAAPGSQIPLPVEPLGARAPPAAEAPAAIVHG